MHVFEILWIVLFRFRPIPRIWATLLILVNSAALFFFDTHYAHITLIAAIAGILVMMVIYSKLGFVRLLGIGHIFWVPMIIWFAMDIPVYSDGPAFFYWVLAIIAFNCISLVLDAIDVSRFLLGEREPFYYWRTENER